MKSSLLSELLHVPLLLCVLFGSIVSLFFSECLFIVVGFHTLMCLAHNRTFCKSIIFI